MLSKVTLSRITSSPPTKRILTGEYIKNRFILPEALLYCQLSYNNKSNEEKEHQQPINKKKDDTYQQSTSIRNKKDDTRVPYQSSSQQKPRPNLTLLVEAVKDIGKASFIVLGLGYSYISRFTKTGTQFIGKRLTRPLHYLDIKVTDLVRRLMINPLDQQAYINTGNNRPEEQRPATTVTNPPIPAVSRGTKRVTQDLEFPLRPAASTAASTTMHPHKIDVQAKNEIVDHIQDSIEGSVDDPVIKERPSMHVNFSNEHEILSDLLPKRQPHATSLIEDEREVIDGLVARGYTERFDFRDDEIVIQRINKSFPLQCITINQVHQFQNNQLRHNTIVFAIEATEESSIRGNVTFRGILRIDEERLLSSKLGKFSHMVSHPTIHTTSTKPTQK